MSELRPQRRFSYLNFGIILFAVIVAALLLLSRQQVVDNVRAWQFTPSSRVVEIRDSLHLSSLGELYFNSSRPEVETASQFNQSCPHSEPNNPVIGCYSNQLIYIFDVENKKLDGIEETTAAHELLHAAYERMSESERAEVDAELQSVYKVVKTKELEARMDYYEKNEPGEENNELHSILGTEFTQLSPRLEGHYQKYFANRGKVLAYYQQYQKAFTTVTSKLNTLAAAINTRTAQVNEDITRYNQDQTVLNGDVKVFEARTFTKQDELDAERLPLVARQNELKRREAEINGEITAINTLRKEYDTLRREYEELSKSINSNLEPAPSLRT